jgi:predicted nucleotidyltransferase
MSKAGHGIAPGALDAMRALCERTPGIERLWLFGSRAAGTHRERSDIDLAVDAPGWSSAEALRFVDALKQLPMVYPVDAVWLQSDLGDVFRQEIRAQRRVLWQPAAALLPARAVGAGVEMKDFQDQVLTRLDAYLRQAISPRRPGPRSSASSCCHRPLPNSRIPAASTARAALCPMCA